MEKDSFVFRKEWRDAISELPDEVRLEIYEAIIEYGTSGKLSDLKPMAMLAFNFAKTTLDKDCERYQKISEKRKEAIKKRWDKNTNDTNDTNVFPKIQMNTNDTNVFPPHSDGDGDSDCDMSSSNEEQKKKPPKGGQKEDAAHAAALLEGRKKVFYNSLIPYVQNYGRELIREFFDYWTEPNKSQTKMRFELERTWDVSRRLSTWSSRDKQFNHNGTNNNRSSSASRAKDAADIIARLAAKEQ